jgi:hypothetical protein
MTFWVSWKLKKKKWSPSWMISFHPYAKISTTTSLKGRGRNFQEMRSSNDATYKFQTNLRTDIWTFFANIRMPSALTNTT